MVVAGTVSGIVDVSKYKPGDRIPIGKIYSSGSGEKVKYGILTNRTKDIDLGDMIVKSREVEYFNGENTQIIYVPFEIQDKQGNVILNSTQLVAIKAVDEAIGTARRIIREREFEERVRQEVEKKINQTQPAQNVNTTSQNTNVNNFSQDLLVKIEEVNSTVANLSQRVDEQERRISWLELIVRKILDWIQRTFGVTL